MFQHRDHRSSGSHRFPFCLRGRTSAGSLARRTIAPFVPDPWVNIREYHRQFAWTQGILHKVTIDGSGFVSYAPDKAFGTLIHYRIEYTFRISLCRVVRYDTPPRFIYVHLVTRPSCPAFIPHLSRLSRSSISSLIDPSSLSFALPNQQSQRSVTPSGGGP